MSSDSPHSYVPRLPLELIYNIIDYCAEVHSPKQPIAFSASHPVTKTLLSLALVSKSISRFVLQHLYRRCTFLDQFDRLHHIQKTLKKHDSSGDKSEQVFRPFIKSAFVEVTDYKLLRDYFLESGGALFLQDTGPYLQRIYLNLGWGGHDFFRPDLMHTDIASDSTLAARTFSAVEEVILIHHCTNLAPQCVGQWHSLRRLCIFDTCIRNLQTLCHGLASIPHFTDLMLHKLEVDKAFTHWNELVDFCNEKTGNCVNVTILIEREKNNLERGEAGTYWFENYDNGTIFIKSLDFHAQRVDGLTDLGVEVKGVEDWIRASALNGTLWDFDESKIKGGYIPFSEST